MFGFALALALAAKTMALAALQAGDQRVANVGWRLQVRNVDVCADRRRLPGFTVHALSQYPKNLQSEAASYYGLGPLPAVLVVAAGSKAEQAGLRPGDAITAIGDQAIEPLTDTTKTYQAVAAIEDKLDDVLTHPPVTLTIKRSGVERRVDLAGDLGCASRIQLVTDGGLNSGADGRYVQITGKMLDFVQDDDELAAIVAHELAHNIFGHRQRLDAAKAGGGMLPGLGKGGAMMRDAERQADRLSVWLVARAGYDVDAVPRFWSRLRTKADFGIFSDGTHPNWNDRLARIAIAIATLKAQRARGEALIPPAAELDQQSPSQPKNRR